MSRVVRPICAIMALALIYASFVDQAIVSEAVAAIVVGSVAWLVVVRFGRVSSEEGRLSLHFIGPFMKRIPYAAVRESLDLLGPMLWRSLIRREPVAGRWIALRYRASDTSAAAEHGRRSIVVFASNLTPNALPLDIDPEAGTMVLHQLLYRRESAASDPEYPF